MKICDRSECCGCLECADICPHGAIKAEKDEYGFARPHIDTSKCVECGLCAKKCPVNIKTECKTEKVYAAFAEDSALRKKSSSGGIFRLLADLTISEGGRVCAVGYDEKFRAVHKIAGSADELNEMMGSKYTQSDTCGIYSECAEVLKSGKKLLFVGTPCQCAAMKEYVGEKETNLLTVDFICHGVPSPTILEKYLAEKFVGDISSVSFRDKSRGWQEFSMKVVQKNGREYSESQYKDPYLRMFLGNTALRESCFDCRFKDRGYRSDITIGDFWGVSSFYPAMNDDKGTSAVVIRTEKGAAAFDKIRSKLKTRESSEEVLRKANAAIATSSKKPAARDEMLIMLKENASFSEMAEKFGKPISFKEIMSERMKKNVKVLLGKIRK